MHALPSNKISQNFTNFQIHEDCVAMETESFIPNNESNNDNISHEGNISKMPDFDVFSVLECKKRKSRSHGKRKNGNIKRKICTEKRLNTSLKDLSLALTNHGRHGLFSFLSSLPISVLRNLELEAYKLYDRANKLYKAALLTRCYVQHFLSPYIDSEVNHKRHFIKIPFINKGIEFIDYIVSSRIIQ